MRLKPKLVAEPVAEAAAEPAAPEPVAPPPPPPLKRKLTPPPEAAFGSPFPTEPAPEPELEPEVPPPVAFNSEPPPPFQAPPPPPPPGVGGDPAEAPRFKLKPKVPGAPLSAPPPPPALSVPLPTGAVLGEVPPLPPSTGMTMPPFPTAIPSSVSRPPVGAPAEAEESDEDEAPKPKNVVLKKAGIAAGILVAFVGVFAFYRAFFAPLPKPVINIVAKPAAKPKPPAATPSPDAAKPAADTAAVPAAPPPVPVAAVDSPKPGPAAATPAPAVAPAPAPKEEHLVVVSSTALAPGITATTTEDAEGPAASAPFLQWVDSAKIGGVFQGKTPRAIINGKIARGGTVVDDDLGISFTAVDVDNRMVIFKDKTGATAKKHY